MVGVSYTRIIACVCPIVHLPLLMPSQLERNVDGRSTLRRMSALQEAAVLRDTARVMRTRCAQQSAPFSPRVREVRAHLPRGCDPSRAHRSAMAIHDKPCHDLVYILGAFSRL